MDTKSKKSKLTVLTLMLAAAFCFSLGAVLADFVAAGLIVFPVVLAMAAALVLGAASLTGTVLLLRRTGYVPRLPAEAGLLFLSGPVLAFLAVSLILPRPEALMPVLLFLAPALTAFFLLLLFVRKRSAAGDAEALVSLISGFSGGAFPKDNPVPGDSPLYESGEQLSSLELSPEARDYADRLESKSKYLYTMVEDLFDLSKAASGNITLQETDLDLGRLIEQTLGDMDEKIRASGFSIRRRMPDSPLMVRTDGNRMHRVFQNLIDNALKYSLPGTRIYLYAEEQPDFISVSIVNTASYDMDFDAETITERFVRGSAARTGEGSGLGLAIARTYTEACGGAFRITVKGDQFEAAVRFPRQHSPIN